MDELIDLIALSLEKTVWCEAHRDKVDTVNGIRGLLVSLGQSVADMQVTNEALVQELSQAAYKLNLYKDKYGDI